MITDWTLAIDFGTTSTVTVIGANGQRPHVLEIGGDRRMPSIVYIDDDESVLVGHVAGGLAMSDPRRGIRGLKRRLGHPTPIVLAGHAHRAVDLVAEILRFAHDEAVRHQGSPPSRTRLTYPATWSRPRRAELLEAAATAGLPDPSLIAEPVAAALTYGETVGIPDGSHVAVFDLGGGTFDTAVLQRSGETFKVVGKPTGDAELGGELFDEIIMNHVGDQLDESQWDEMMTSDDLPWRQSASRLRAECKRVKEAVSAHDYGELVVGTPNGLSQLRLTRTEVEELLEPHIDEALHLLARCIGDAGVPASDLAAIFVAGGASRMPLIEQKLREAYPDVTIGLQGDPKAAVAYGALVATPATIDAGLTPAEAAPIAPIAPLAAPLPPTSPVTRAESVPTVPPTPPPSHATAHPPATQAPATQPPATQPPATPQVDSTDTAAPPPTSVDAAAPPPQPSAHTAPPVEDAIPSAPPATWAPQPTPPLSAPLTSSPTPTPASTGTPTSPGTVAGQHAPGGITAPGTQPLEGPGESGGPGRGLLIAALVGVVALIAAVGGFFAFRGDDTANPSPTTPPVSNEVVTTPPPTADPDEPVTVDVGVGGDYPTIEAALADVSDGSTLLLGAETFTLANSIEIDRDITIAGAGSDATTITAEAKMDRSVLRFRDASVTLTGVTVAYTGIEPTNIIEFSSADIEITDVTVQGARFDPNDPTFSDSGNGIAVLGTTSGTLESITAIENEIGIGFHDRTSVSISMSTASDNRDHGFGFFDTSSVSASNNTSSTNGITGFAVFNTASPSLVANTASGNEAAGFVWFDSGAGLARDNTADANLSNGFELQSTATPNLIANFATNNEADGFRWTDQSAGTASGNEATDNLSDGFVTVGMATPTLTSNLATGNTIDGFAFDESSEPVLTANTADDNGEAGYSWFGDAAGTARDNNASGNLVAGFYMGGQSAPTLTSNTSDSNPGTGFLWTNDATGTGEENVANANTLNGFEVQGSAAPTLTMNDSTDNLGAGYGWFGQGAGTATENTASGNNSDVFVEDGATPELLDNGF